MERRYLGATIAMAATFALFSHGFSSGMFSRLQQPPTTLISETRCAAQQLRARLLDKVNQSLGPGSAEEAQLRVEFNLAAPAVAAAPVPPVAPKAPVAPMKPVQASAAPPMACTAARLASDVTLSQRIQQAKIIAIQTQVQTRALQHEAQLQARTLQREIARAQRDAQREVARSQREIARAAVAQARANLHQMRWNTSSPCRGNAAASQRAARSAHDADDDTPDLERLSHDIEEEVSRSLDVNVRNF